MVPPYRRTALVVGHAMHTVFDSPKGDLVKQKVSARADLAPFHNRNIGYLHHLPTQCNATHQQSNKTPKDAPSLNAKTAFFFKILIPEDSGSLRIRRE
jgi:hypothetical protein